ncbi:LacI family transcriptional regulator [Ruminococcaceae bacterium OttesenSCG-928-L11]|nr:LacI family transcriptional regulator [Ruminococcaceae bacterium OttesenSCG-928-L11]
MARRVTVRDIAEAANVTAATVSYVLNNSPNQSISQETRERVLKAAEELQYVPNTAARSLKNRRSHTIGVAIEKNLSTPRFSQTVAGIRKVLDAHGYNILLCGFQKRHGIHVDYLNNYFEGRVDGVIFLGKDNQGPDAAAVQMIADRRIPFVAFDCCQADTGYSTVDFDYQQGAQTVAQRLLTHCWERLVYIRPQMDTTQEQAREAGVRAAAAGFPHIRLEILTVAITQEDLDAMDDAGYENIPEIASRVSASMTQALERLPALISSGDAVISSWESWAGLIRARCEGLDIAIGELANSRDGRSNADLSLQLPNFRAGQQCAELLLQALDNTPPQSVVLAQTCVDSSALPYVGI